MNVADVFWLANYGISLVGSVSFGYLFLRYSVPDIRTVPRQVKLGLSGAMGLIFFGIAAAVSAFMGPIYVLIVLPLVATVSAGLFGMRNMVAADTMRVAVPVARVTATPSYMPEEAPAARKPEKRRRPEVPLERPHVVIEEKIVAKEKPVAEEKPAPSLAAKLRLKLEEKPPEEAPRQVEAAPAAPKIEERQPEEAPERPAAAEAGGVPERVRKYEERRAAAEARKAAPAGPAEVQPAEARPEAAPGVAAEVPRGRGRRAPKEEEVAPAASERKRRYMQRRGQLVDEAVDNMTAPSAAGGAAAPAAEAGGLDLSGLGEAGSLDELGSLGELGSLSELSGELDLGSLAGLSEIETVPKQKGMGCPKCHSVKGMIVYCPYCGKGFCTDCSGKVEAKMDLIFYQCPHCTKEVIVKQPGK